MSSRLVWEVKCSTRLCGDGRGIGSFRGNRFMTWTGFITGIQSRRRV